MNLKPRVQKEEETNLVTYENSLANYIPSMGILQGNNPELKAKGNNFGDFFDYGKKQNLGNPLRACAIDYRLQIRYSKKKGDSSEFQETLILQSDEDWKSSPKLKEMDEKYKSTDKVKYEATEALDLLVYLPDYDMFRRFWCKGKLAEGGTELREKSIEKTEKGYEFRVCELTTKEVEGKSFSWYEFNVDQIMDKEPNFPNNTITIIEQFKKPQDREEEEGNNAEKALEKTGRKRK